VRVIDFIFAARPMLLLPVWSLYLISHKFYSADQALCSSGIIILAGLTLLFAGAYYINQIYDYQSDLINRKLGFLQSGKITKDEMKVAYLIISIIPLATAFIDGYFLGSIFLGIFLLGLIYSAPPLRLKDRPLSGLLSNSIAYGVLVPLAAAKNSAGFDYLTLILPTYFFLTVSAGYLLTIIPDRTGDAESGKKTLAVLLSDKSIIIVALILLMFSSLIAWEINYLYLLVISILSLFLFALALILLNSKIVLFACKLPILFMSLLAGFYYPGYLVFLLALLFMTRLYYKKRFGIVYPRIN
jgi:4-hydroxybenzoate polyprenyltransferase